MSLAIKERPTTLADVVGQPKACRIIQRFMDNGTLAGRAYMITGGSGQGKTTLGLIIAKYLAEDFCISEIASASLTPAGVADIERGLAYRGAGKGGRAVLVNEAHAISPKALTALLDALERIPGHAAWVFTTSKAGSEKMAEGHDDAIPLFSRCIEIPLVKKVQPQFARLAFDIATRHGLTDKSITAFERLAKDCAGNLRRMLNAIESGAMLS